MLVETFLSLITLTFNTPTPELRVGIIDTGVSKHEAFDGVKIISDGDDYHGHGTHIASIIARNACKSVKIYSCKIDLKNPSTYLSCLDKLKDVHVLNISLEGTGVNIEERIKIERITFNGYVLAAAGNSNLNINTYPAYPAYYGKTNNRVLAIGALTESGMHKWGRSNFGDFVKWSIGENVIGANMNGGYIKMSGTSQAAANATSTFVKKWCER